MALRFWTHTLLALAASGCVRPPQVPIDGISRSEVRVMSTPRPFTYWIGNRQIGPDVAAVVEELKRSGVTRVVVRAHYKPFDGVACRIYVPLHDAGLEVAEFWARSPIAPGWTDLMTEGSTDFGTCPRAVPTGR